MEKRKLNVKKVIGTIVIILAIVISLAAVIIRKRNKEKDMYMFPNYAKNIVLDGVGIQSIIEYDPAYIAVHYPIIASEQINDIVYGMIEAELNDFDAKIQEYGSKERPELSVTFETYKYKTRMISFKFVIYDNFSGQADGISRIVTMTFDMNSEKQIALGDLFLDGNYLQMLSDKSYQHFSKQEEYKNNLKILEEGLNPNIENFSNFILTDNYLELIFSPYQISSKMKGAITYKIPISEIKAYMNSSILEEKVVEEKETPSGETKVPDVVDIPQENLEELRDKKLIAITFDDGPDKKCTNEILDILKEEDIKATFFVLGSRAEYYPETIKRIVAEGHQIGSHTYSHKHLKKLSEEEIQYEINITNQIIADITGVTVSAIRTPYGEVNDVIKRNANLPIILWSVDPEDWREPEGEIVCEAIISHVKEGDIILLHDIYETTVEGTRLTIQRLKAEGYTFVTVETLIKAKYGEIVNNQVYRYVR